jgi:hypothetical protein
MALVGGFLVSGQLAVDKSNSVEPNLTEFLTA